MVCQDVTFVDPLELTEIQAMLEQREQMVNQDVMETLAEMVLLDTEETLVLMDYQEVKDYQEMMAMLEETDMQVDQDLLAPEETPVLEETMVNLDHQETQDMLDVTDVMVTKDTLETLELTATQDKALTVPDLPETLDHQENLDLQLLDLLDPMDPQDRVDYLDPLEQPDLPAALEQKESVEILVQMVELLVVAEPFVVIPVHLEVVVYRGQQSVQIMLKAKRMLYTVKQKPTQTAHSEALHYKVTALSSWIPPPVQGGDKISQKLVHVSLISVYNRSWNVLVKNAR